MITIKTGCWFTNIPDDHIRISISRGRPRGIGGYRSPRFASSKPVAFPIHLQDVDMMGEAVEQSTGKPFRTEYGCPFIEWQVAAKRFFGMATSAIWNAT